MANGRPGARNGRAPLGESATRGRPSGTTRQAGTPADAAEMVRRQGGVSTPGLFAATGPARSERKAQDILDWVSCSETYSKMAMLGGWGGESYKLRWRSAFLHGRLHEAVGPGGREALKSLVSFGELQDREGFAVDHLRFREDLT